MRLALTLLARDEEDVIAANVEYHLAMGVDMVIAMENRSEDTTAEILRSYESTGRLVLLRESGDDHQQSRWVTRMARLACTDFGADWIINSDADEFWWPASGTLKSTLRQISDRYGLVTAYRRNFVPTPPSPAPFFERMVLADPDSRNSLGSRLAPKVCHRAAANITVSEGNHAVSGGDLEPLPDHQLLTVLHFPMRSYQQFERKVILAGAAYARRGQTTPVGGNARHLYREYLRRRLPDYYDANVVDPDDAKHAVAAGSLVLDLRLRTFLRSAGLPRDARHSTGSGRSGSIGEPQPTSRGEAVAVTPAPAPTEAAARLGRRKQ